MIKGARLLIREDTNPGGVWIHKPNRRNTSDMSMPTKKESQCLRLRFQATYVFKVRSLASQRLRTSRAP